MKRHTLLLTIGGILNIATLIWVGGIMPSTPAEGYRPYMTTIGIALFCLGISMMFLGLFIYFKYSRR